MLWGIMYGKVKPLGCLRQFGLELFRTLKLLFLKNHPKHEQEPLHAIIRENQVLEWLLSK